MSKEYLELKKEFPEYTDREIILMIKYCQKKVKKKTKEVKNLQMRIDHKNL